MNQHMVGRHSDNPRRIVTLLPIDLLRFRLRKLMAQVIGRVAARTEMFDKGRIPGDISEAAEYFPMFVVTYMAVAWSIYIAYALPQEDTEIYSRKYLDLTMNDEGFLSVLVRHIIEENLLPEYRLGYLVAMLECCHMTLHADAQKGLWREFAVQLSNLLSSMSSHMDRGVQIYEEYSTGNGKTDRTAE